MSKELSELKRILKDNQYGKVGGQEVDLQTANVMLKVREALNKEHQLHFDKMLKTPTGVKRLADFSWGRVK